LHKSKKGSGDTGVYEAISKKRCRESADRRAVFISPSHSSYLETVTDIVYKIADIRQTDYSSSASGIDRLSIFGNNAEKMKELEDPKKEMLDFFKKVK